MAFLEVEAIGKKQNGTYTVKDINFTQQPLEKIAIAGETGSGKTTLLKIIGGLEQPDDGHVYFENERILGPWEKLIPGHPAIGYLSQHFELRNNYRVEEELESKNELTEAAAQKIYAICKIEHLLKRKTDQLSGGERQRIVLARLLTTSPRLLLLDEPFSNLDALHKAVMKKVLEDIGEQLQISCILVSHDAADTLSWADRILVLKDGKIQQEGTAENMYRKPVDEYCAGLFGEYNLLNVENVKAFGVQNQPQPVIIRPEQFIIVTEPTTAVEAVVTAINFFGNYYKVQVTVNNQSLILYTDNKLTLPGHIIYLQIK